ncbi:DNA adenine methylase [Pseudoalteromonas nigrifaciens]|uniref:DNA adenine methylase n=1 Tax=Pseudoalteromonas nigrifaciens TaxID=28109 RepID=UPI00178898CF|nr:DNA adenine methylase [Pseudoalteromonas nigrifaciens]MBE0418532.1 DNA adenine methylase [Pseudoalteromonas nigrifaciens]
MKYMGSKNRLAKHILPIMLKDRKDGQHWVEPFVGGANMIDKVDGNRIGADFNKDLINLLIGLQGGWIPNESYTKEEYLSAQKGLNPCKIETGYIAFNCSYSGKYWGRFAGKSNTAKGVRDYTNEAYKNVVKQTPNLLGISFKHSSYEELDIPDNSIIYCDPPYEGTYSDIEGYGKLAFNHTEFWQWCRDKAKDGHTVFVSEYNAPDDFECIWQQEVKSSLSANGKSGGSKKSIEKLFTI